MSISVGIAVYNILSTDTGTTTSSGVTDYVGAKIYPIFAPDKTLAPFIVYDIKSVKPTYTKDRILYDEDTVIVYIVASDYGDGVLTTDAVRNALDSKVGTFNGSQIYGCRVSNVTQAYGVDGFVFEIELEIRSNPTLI